MNLSNPSSGARRTGRIPTRGAPSTSDVEIRTDGEESGGIERRVVLVFAIACGMSVANLYYAQPLLHTIGRSFGAGSASTGLIVTFTQIGYALGLAFVVPLGDLLDRRRLIPTILFATACALVASSFAPDLGVLIALALVIGVCSVAAQILVPLAAQLANDDERGQVVGRVMSGLLIGILLARTLSGVIAGASSWRVVYSVGAGLVLLLACTLTRLLPVERDRPVLAYRELLGSTVDLFRSEPLLRRRAGFGALGFAAFSTLWTTIAFLLAGAPYHYRVGVIGLFGLVGAAGALCATLAGRFADRGQTARATALFCSCLVVAFLPIWLGRHTLGWLIVGIVLLDLGVQGLHVTNQTLIYTLAPDARSRITSAYMVIYFIGGAIGSAVAAAAYDAGEWSAVCILGAGIGAVALVGCALDRGSPVAAKNRPVTG